MLQVMAYVAYYLCFAFLMLGMEARGVFMLSKHCTT